MASSSLATQRIPMLEFILLVGSMMSSVALCIDAVLPSLGYMAVDFAVSGSEIQLVITTVFVGFALGQLIYGPLSDRWGRLPSIYAGLLVLAIGSAIAMSAQSLETMLLGRFLQGVGASGPRIMVSALVRDCFSGRKMARVMSFVGTVFMMVPLLAPMLGQAILWLGPWQYIFVMYIGVAFILACWVYLRLHETLPPENRRSVHPIALWQAFLIVIRNRSAAGYTVASGILFGAFLGYLSSSQLVFQDIYLVGDAYPLYFAFLVLPNVASSLLNAKLVMRWGMYRVVQTTNILVLIGATSLYFYAQTYAGVPPLTYYMVFLFFIFSGVGLQFGNLNTLAMEPLGKVAGMGASIVGTGSTLVSIPIGGLIGMSISQSVTPLALGLAICALISMLLMHWVRFGGRLPA